MCHTYTMCAWSNIRFKGHAGHFFHTMPAFNFLDCVAHWDAQPHLRRRARAMQVLVEDQKKKKIVLPTLANMSLNSSAIRPFTLTMAKYGIIRKDICLIQDALWKFYLEELPEEQKSEAFRLKPKVKSTAIFMQRMLTQIKRKWTRWELPRAP